MSNGENQPLIDGKTSVEDALKLAPDFTFQGDYEGYEIIYVTGEGYKLAVDLGEMVYIIDLPDDYVLSDISNTPNRGEDAKHTDAEEAEARENNGIRPDLSLDNFNSGFGEGTVVSVPIEIVDMPEGSDAAGIARNFVESINRSRNRITSTLLNDDRYVGLLTAELIANGGDMATALTNVVTLDAYGDILRDLGYTQSMIDSERLEFTDSLQFDKNYQNYYDLFKRTALTSYGQEIPETVLDYLATQTNRGWFSPEEAITQINGIYDSYANITLDTGVINALEGITIESTKTGEEDVQDLLDKWLPEHLHSYFDKAEEAGKIRNNSLARGDLINRLQKHRFKFYDMYDEDIAWSTIVGAKTQSAKNILGVDLSSDDAVLDTIIKMNDKGQEEEYLRKTGVERGYKKTKQDLTLSMMSAFGSNIVRGQSFRG